MGGAAMGDGDEAVQVNVTPLIDIIFCLCLFFLCSLKFKQLEGKMDSWLPKDKGNQAGGVANATMDEMRIFVRLKQGTTDVEMAFGSQVIPTARDPETGKDGPDLGALRKLISDGWHDFETAGKKDGSVIIDGEPRVPWKDVIAVLDVCKDNRYPADSKDPKDKHPIDKVEFAQPMPTLAPKPSSG